MTVNAHFTDADIKNIENDEQVTVLALQVSKGDTVVTSDYAAVKAAYYKDLVLAAVDSIHANDRHLFTTAAELLLIMNMFARLSGTAMVSILLVWSILTELI